MSKLQMQHSKELKHRAAAAKRKQRERFRPLGLDETVDLRDAPRFYTVPKHVDDVRLNEATFDIEVMSKGKVVKTLNGSMDDMNRQIDAILASLPPAFKQTWLRKIRAVHDALGARIALSDWAAAAKEEVKALPLWARGGIVYERPDRSSLREIIDALRSQRILATKKTFEELERRFAEAPTAFLIEHDWAAAFRNADDFDDGECPLPYDDTLFEFRISGRKVCVYAAADGWRVLLISLSGGWMAAANDDVAGESFLGDEAILTLGADKQIRAACIALDAEVAIKEVVQADEKLNLAREKRGKPPLLDYHVIRLARRERAAPLPSSEDGERQHRSPRLHFVRGHWRRYAEHKTWIKWFLRGDPDLGFIDKHYRL